MQNDEYQIHKANNAKSELIVSSEARNAWLVFLNNQQNLGHTQRYTSGESIESHIYDGLRTTRATITRVKNDLNGMLPKRILEIGCSAGLNCFALQEAFLDAEVYGIEPEDEALSAAKSLSLNYLGRDPIFVQGVGESLPFPDCSIDLILCHTVIEHVRYVPQVISEMARVLSPQGFIHLEAPNYLWPYEPHLGVWTIPIMGKRFVGACACLQGRKSMIPFLEHLQFVTPFELERVFAKNKLIWRNRYRDKFQKVIIGQGDVKQYKFSARLLGLLGRLGFASTIENLVFKSGIYPSVMYLLWKDSEKRH